MTGPTPVPPPGEGFTDALADALARLKTAERTIAELRTALLPCHGERATEAALAYLAAKKLVSEDRAAEATIRPRAEGRRAEGDVRLRRRLERRGAAPDAIERALVGLPDEAQRMQDALAAKFKTPDPSQRGKAGRFLLSRGFDEDAVEGALTRLFGDAEE